MTFLRLALAACLTAALGWAAPAVAQALGPMTSTAHSSVVTTDQVRAELLAWAPQGVTPGQPLWVGLQLTHQPDWHTYWKNSGDSGLPTQLDWQLPAGMDAGEIAWPTPRKIAIGTLANYGYEHTVLLPVPLTVSPNFAQAGNPLGNLGGAQQVEIKLKASWLVCRKECIPQEGDFTLSLPVKSSTATSSKEFEAALAAGPQALPSGSSLAEPDGRLLRVSLTGLPAALQGKDLALYPETSSIIEPAGAWQQAWQGAVWTAQLPLSAHRTDSPASLPLVVAVGDAAYRIDAPVKGAWPAAAPVATVSPALEAALRANAASPVASTNHSPPLTLWAALFGALLGGLILNLMPCVFPVLAIKVVGFVAIRDRATRVTTGVAYTVGVVVSFLALGALLLGLRAAGDQLGWGFQLQSPAVVAALAALFTLMGLNLAGLFEFGNMLPGRLAGAQARNPTLNAFLSGVLATAIASPCTAPFMGASLGYAVGLPAGQALAVFGAIGIGMALPYLLVSLVPGVARALPRPGPWMVTFKQLMAFPMFATVAWLVWVLGQQSGIDGAGALLILLVLMALLLWSLTLKGRTRMLVGAFSLLVAVAGFWAVGPHVIKPMELASSANTASTDRWQTWAPGKVEQLSTQGRSVFVDFTAAWCVTCQYNKKATLANAEVLADLGAKNVALLRADWTRRDPDVTAALRQLGRSGVPVYVIYHPGRAPVVLSEILSVADVRAELAKL